jgi:5-methyltetrahydrofolate--homocysteine methyltransferase
MIIVGEKINGTLPGVREAVLARDEGVIRELCVLQAAAGADYIDVNVGTGSGDEASAMEWALGIVMVSTEASVAVDSADPSVLERGLEALDGRTTLINSVNGDPSRTESVLPLAARYSSRVVALAMDGSGIPELPGARLDVCRRIADRAEHHGVPLENLYFDPLALPVSADCEQGRVTLETLELIKSELPGAGTILGLSNVSFGLPARSTVNQAMMAAAVRAGLDAAIIDPTDRDLVAMAFAAEAVSGRDGYCRSYMKAFRSGLLG